MMPARVRGGGMDLKDDSRGSTLASIVLSEGMTRGGQLKFFGDMSYKAADQQHFSTP
jgi:hypothetical protein